MLSTQFKYISFNLFIASRSSPPIKTLSGNAKSLIALPSDRNSGLDNTQKDFESVVQCIGLRAMPVVMNEPVELSGSGSFVLENYGAPTLTGAGFIFKFAFEREGVHTITTLTDELHGIVLNAGTVDTKSSLNMEFTKQDLL